MHVNTACEFLGQIKPNESKFEDDRLVLTYSVRVEGGPLYEHAVSRIEAKSRLSQIRQYSGISGEAVWDSRLVVAFSIPLTFGGALKVNLGLR